MVMLPGLDGTGRLFVSQMRSLSQSFDVRCLHIPHENRQDWSELAHAVIDLVQEIRGNRHFVYLCGESFGGCLALQIALLEPTLMSHLVVINPASALRRYTWTRWTTQYVDFVPGWLFKMSGAVALPLLANFDRINDEKKLLFINTVRPIPQDCVTWRIGMLHRFQVQPEQLEEIVVPTALLASQRDRLFPSDREALLLQESLPNSKVHFLPKSGHVCLLEDEVDLVQCLKALHFLPVPSTSFPSLSY